MRNVIVRISEENQDTPPDYAQPASSAEQQPASWAAFVTSSPEPDQTMQPKEAENPPLGHEMLNCADIQGVAAIRLASRSWVRSLPDLVNYMPVLSHQSLDPFDTYLIILEIQAFRIKSRFEVQRLILKRYRIDFLRLFPAWRTMIGQQSEHIIHLLRNPIDMYLNHRTLQGDIVPMSINPKKSIAALALPTPTHHQPIGNLTISIHLFERDTDLTTTDGYLMTTGTRAVLRLSASLSDTQREQGKHALLQIARERKKPGIFFWHPILVDQPAAPTADAAALAPEPAPDAGDKRDAWIAHRVTTQLEERYDYELFRRAIVERDEDAWAAIYERYRSLLMSWAVSCSRKMWVNERYDDIADQALTRAWLALTPKRFAGFASLAALLAYLHTCVTATVIDHARAQAARQRMMQQIEVDTIATPEQIVLGRIEREQLWQLLVNCVTAKPEYTFLVERFVFELPPRLILVRHPELFTDIGALYAIRRNLLLRLQCNPALRQLYQELQPA
jgi:DNA-directed RNA polymerase specialized sigma24 family protein